ncbi:hypothetical protein [Fibrella arboris]|uniref:hypothetical protein n=1 Tax=Fibrella arboris TaxID=3242486 RepID=UPI00351F9EDB
MNSSDDSTDKALKERFQQLFNEFERTPSSSLKQQIWKHLPATSTTRRRYVVLAIVLLLLIGGAFYGPQRLLNSPTTHALPDRLVNDQRRTGSPPTQAQLAANTDRAATGVDKRVATQPDRLSTLPKAPPAHPAFSTKPAPPGQPVHLADRIARSRPASDQVRLPAAARQADQLTGRPPASPIDKPASPTLWRSTPVHAMAQPVVADSVFGQAAVSALQPMTIRPFCVPDNPLTKQVVPLPQQPTEATAENRRPPLQWLASVAPLSTYQWMTVVARPETYVQQVGTPAAFAGPTWGYQVSGGLVWRQLAVQLMAGQLKRWAYYDVATNEYRIDPTGPGAYRITQLSRSVVETGSLTMLGASLAKESALSKRPGRLVASLGGQGTYLPATGQLLVWGQAALITGIPLKTAYSVHVGPTVQYGFSRLYSGDRQLVIHPFLVGVSLSIRPSAL